MTRGTWPTNDHVPRLRRFQDGFEHRLCEVVVDLDAIDTLIDQKIHSADGALRRINDPVRRKHGRVAVEDGAGDEHPRTYAFAGVDRLSQEPLDVVYAARISNRRHAVG